MYVWQHDDYCLHSQVDLCLFCMNICTLMTLLGARYLSSVNQDVASLVQCDYWKLGIHCLRLPEFNVYTSRDLRPHPLLPLPGRNKGLNIVTIMNVMTII